MKKLVLVISACLLAVLSACGAPAQLDAGLVFINDSDAVIVEVVVNFEDRTGGSRNADGSPLKKGDSLGFEAGEYPVTVAVYDRAVGSFAEGALACITVDSAPTEGERWYVTARDGVNGLTLLADTIWPTDGE